MAACAASHLPAADLATDDGLTLHLDDGSGQISRVVADGRALPMLPNVRSGFSCVEFTRTIWDTPRPIARITFEEAEENWLKVGMMKIGPNAAAAKQTDGTGTYVRIGQHQRYGHGVIMRKSAAVQPGGVYNVLWQARVPAKSSTYIVYIRVFDAERKDLTKTALPKGKWRYSPWTETHYQYAIATKRVGVWEPLCLSYAAPERARFIRVAVCLWRGDYADVDSLNIVETGRATWEEIAMPERRSLKMDDGRLRQRMVAPQQQVELTCTHERREHCIWVEAEVRDLHEPVKDRAVEIRYTLPVQAKGWSWGDDIRTSRRIEPDVVYQNVFGCGSHAVSLYPFSSIHDRDVGLVLAVPMDWPRVERRSYSVATGYQIAFDVGLSPHTAKLGPGRAKVAFAIYHTDGEWGFRSAAAKYYEISPQFFAKRAEREGAWMFVVRPTEVPNLSDFGMVFYEGFLSSAKDQELARQLGMFVLPYTEPWGLRQAFADAKERSDMPPYEARLRQLRDWAADKETERKWLRGPRHEVAQAVLNSLPTLADGRAPFSVDKYGSWAQWWRTNPDPDLPMPNRASVCRKYRIVPYWANSHGVYLDSVSIWGDTYENYRASHLACADLPLTFSTATGKPVLLGMMSRYEFIDWLAADLRKHGRLLHMNLFGGAHRFHAHLADVLGSEVGSSGRNRRLHAVETDTTSNLRRTYAYRKPVTNLLQEGNYRTPVPPITHEQVEQYVKHQAFYGFYPAISSGGGEERPGYRGWKRYFRSPELFERDRAIFRKYMPVIRRINQAGWEPVTYAHTSDPQVFVERFGSWRRGNLHFTLRNQSVERSDTTVRVQLGALGAASGELNRAKVVDMVTQKQLGAGAIADEGILAVNLALDTFDTRIVQVRADNGE